MTRYKKGLINANSLEKVLMKKFGNSINCQIATLETFLDANDEEKDKSLRNF